MGKARHGWEWWSNEVQGKARLGEMGQGWARWSKVEQGVARLGEVGQGWTKWIHLLRGSTTRGKGNGQEGKATYFILPLFFIPVSVSGPSQGCAGVKGSYRKEFVVREKKRRNSSLSLLFVPPS